MLPAASSVTPGISLLPRVRGPIPERNRKSPTRLACGNAPTGSGARELSKDLLILNRIFLYPQITQIYTDFFQLVFSLSESALICAICGRCPLRLRSPARAQVFPLSTINTQLLAAGYPPAIAP